MIEGCMIGAVLMLIFIRLTLGSMESILEEIRDELRILNKNKGDKHG